MTLVGAPDRVIQRPAVLVGAGIGATIGATIGLATGGIGTAVTVPGAVVGGEGAREGAGSLVRWLRPNGRLHGAVRS